MGREHTFQFTGNAREYFGIWIVNLFLSVITLGIYTAWAKVRRLRYFYGNTYLDGHTFEYHARPMQILIGRIIVVLAIFAFNIASWYTIYTPLLLVPYVIALPWILNKALAFNARMTSYRNVRLSFSGNYWHALGIFIVMPFAVSATAGMLAPIMSRMYSMYVGGNLKFGTAHFQTDTPLKPLYKNLGASVLFFLAAAVVCGIIGAGLGALAAWSGVLKLIEGSGGFFQGNSTQALTIASTFGAFMFMYLAGVLTFLFYRAGVRNIAYNCTLLDGQHRLGSNLSRRRYVWIMVTNFLATIATIGLARPWAAVRTWTYLAQHTSLTGPETLDQFVDEQVDAGQAAPAEFLDIEGIDFGL